MAATEIRRVSLLRIFLFVSLDKHVLLHRRCLMSKFSEILILVCRKIISAFYPILHETFPNSCGFALIEDPKLFSPHLVFIIGNIFVQSWLIWATFHTASHQKWLLLSSDLKNVLTKHFPKMQPFAYVFQRRCSYKFPDIHKKISVLKSLFNKVIGLMVCYFIKKELQQWCFPVNITKCLRIAFFMEHLRWLFWKWLKNF